MSKLFTLPEQNLRFKWSPSLKIQSVVRKMNVVDLEEVDRVDTKDALLATYHDFKLAAKYGINDVELNRSDAKSVCLLYIRRSLIEDEVGRFSVGFEGFILQYIRDNIERCLSYAISLFFSFYNNVDYHIKLFGLAIADTLEKIDTERFFNWKTHIRLFRENPEKYTLEILESVGYSFSELIEKLGLKEEIHIASPFIESTVKYLFKSQLLSWQAKVNMLQGIFKEKRYESSLAEAINAIFQDQDVQKIIRNKNIDNTNPYIESVLGFLTKRWGDPRASAFTSGGWRYINEEVKDYFRVIFAKNDLDVFFAITDRLKIDTNWRYRKQFWEAYLPYIVRTHVLLSYEGVQQAVRYNNQNSDNLLRFGNLSTSQKNAFILQIGSAVLVEWSDNGKLGIITNCTYSMIDEIFSLYRVSEFDLKRMVNRISYAQIAHTYPSRYSWQRKAEKLLYDILGVKPAKSYRLAW